ncbi:DsbE family thiol:disulfide interchange protein [Moraxella porci]|uniref:Thiol:disulfide interchange protein n=1 Tax=Moraxella porci DSM 25326 TaxID=573983 RepID=A0A1T0CSI3_9GAMM|nr:DsbE family thiol:disulfide interchange protein [Moraxella porci]MDH2273473.1 DsbE family thiol:disulfide interchange protein [Moraxella porci]OOS25300.1 thiol:disulfide interchange protein [Moraxella porci DSM 25326]
MTRNKRLWVFIIPLLVFVVLVVMLFRQLGKPTEVNTSRVVGQPLPEFSLPLLSDTARQMTKADLPNSPFLLNVWGSWCPTCYVEHPFLMQLHAKGVPMVGVNYKDELPDALAYLNEYQDPFMFSIQDLSGEYALDLGLMGAPESYVVGADGVVYQHIVGEVGEMNWAQIESCMTTVADAALDRDAKLAACQ